MTRHRVLFVLKATRSNQNLLKTFPKNFIRPVALLPQIRFFNLFILQKHCSSVHQNDAATVSTAVIHKQSITDIKRPVLGSLSRLSPCQTMFDLLFSVPLQMVFLHNQLDVSVHRIWFSMNTYK